MLQDKGSKACLNSRLGWSWDSEYKPPVVSAAVVSDSDDDDEEYTQEVRGYLVLVLYLIISKMCLFKE